MEKHKFSFRCIAYQEKDGTFTGVCLDLDIVEEGHTSLQEAVLSIHDALDSHVQAASKLGFPKELMFRPAPKDYFQKLAEIIKEKPTKPPFDQFQFFSVQPY